MVEFILAVCGVAERPELPNPCGARPESVLLPCAFQVRPEDCGLEALLLKVLLLERAACDCPCDCDAEGGRLEESCDWRELLNPCGLLPPRAEFPAGLLPA